MTRFLLSLIAVLAPSLATGADAVITIAEVRSLDTATLSARLLPGELASRVTAHRIEEHLGSPSTINFAFASKPMVDRVCGRREVSVLLHRLQPGGLNLRVDERSPWHAFRIGVADQCDHPAGARFASMPRDVDPHAAAQAVAWLLRVQSGTRAGFDSMPDVACASESPAEAACAGGSRAVLAALPIEQIYRIESFTGPYGDSGWTLLLGEGLPVPVAWRVTMTRSSEVGYRIALTRFHPPPF